jgi:hypothetical protein
VAECRAKHYFGNGNGNGNGIQGYVGGQTGGSQRV